MTMPHTLIRAKGLPEPISHYSDAVRAGNTIYAAGQGAFDSDGRLVGRGDVVAQTRKVLDNLRLALEAGGGSLDDVTKVTVYLANVADRPAVNEVRKEYFGANKPASTLIGINQFAIDGMLIEIEAIAVVKGERRSSGARAGGRRETRSRTGQSRRSKSRR
jgi:2-iminobutanoate/2-iminopropanoate deaminase